MGKDGVEDWDGAKMGSGTGMGVRDGDGTKLDGNWGQVWGQGWDKDGVRDRIRDGGQKWG